MNKVQYDNEALFENFPKLIRPKVLADLLGISVNTIYDWKYRGKTRRIPDNLFIKICGILYVRKDILKEWMIGRNSSF